MNIVDRGTGTPVVLIPGIQGRWEWMSPAIDALTAGHRALFERLGDVIGQALKVAAGGGTPSCA